MRIISWNCNGGLLTKLPLLTALKPDILLLQECSKRHVSESGAAWSHWVGKNPHRGIGALVFGDLAIDTTKSFPIRLPWFQPLRLPASNLAILNAWACAPSASLRYVRLMHKALDWYLRDLKPDRPGLIAGDLNSNRQFDGKHGKITHTALIDRLSALDLVSVYHHTTGEAQGSESIPTFYLYRHLERPYHLDYVFLPRSLLENTTLSIGEPADWLPFSDHMPLILDFYPAD